MITMERTHTGKSMHAWVLSEGPATFSYHWIWSTFKRPVLDIKLPQDLPKECKQAVEDQ